MKRAIILVIGIWIALASCTERMICPAYQSAYIYDKDELRKKFSYFLDDSTPKVYTASKNKYLVAEPVSYSRKVRSMQTVAMKPVRVVVPDSISGKKGPGSDSVTMDEMRRATQSVVDSTFIVDTPRDSVPTEPLDSIYVISKDKEVRLLVYNGPDSLDYDSVQQRYVKQKPQYYIRDVRFNLEQDHYMWYLRDEIMLPDVMLARKQQGGDGSGEGGSKEKRGLKGFFKNLFKKKPKEAPADTTSAAPAEEFDYIDEADTTAQTDAPVPGQPEVKPKKEKKGLFGRKKDKPTKKKDEPKKEDEDPAEKKKDDEDDGF